MILLVIAALVGLGLAIGPAIRLDRADQWADIREWHLLHGPTDGCVECEEK